MSAAGPRRGSAPLGGSAAQHAQAWGPIQHFVIDIVVPVYNAPGELADCVTSVLAHLRPDVRLVLIDDASPDPRIAAYFAELEQRGHPQIVLLRNERNLGFTATANRGMALSRADAVLLNSDTIVTNGWLDAIMHCAATDARIGTITPFSNNAEICSFPRFCEDNPWPPGADPEPVRRAIAEAAVPTYPDLPTGVGFCMYLRRALLDEVGLFDMAFGRGYGEENDLCLNAARKGWRNVLADNAFVVHTGERSFAGQKAELGPRNMTLLLARHPDYLDMVRAYIAADPLRPLRDAAAMRCEAAARPGRGILHVIHHHGGGTEAHVRALIAGSRERWRHYLAIAVGDRWQVEEHRIDGDVVTFDLLRNPDEAWPEFVGALCASFGIALIHLHNISACRDGIIAALEHLPVPYGYTVHDLNFACPTITFLAADGMYCGAQTDPAVCRRCLAAQPAFEHVDIAAWRARHHRLLERAVFRVAPSRWAAATLAAYFPDCPATVVAHGGVADGTPATPGARTAVLLADDDVPTIAVLGAIGPDKGARRIERLVALARERNARVRFVVIGYLDVEHGPWQSDDAVLTVHGRYAPSDLPDLLAHYRARLVLYPSAGPETFSFTLTEAWSAGRPVLVPPIGALVERVVGSGAGFVMADAEWRDEARMLERIVALVEPGGRTELDAASRATQSLHHATVDEMAAATSALYEDAVRAPRAGGPPMKPLAPARLRYALSYVPWHPPQVVAGDASASGVLARLARAAARHRDTPAGRVLVRLAPARVLAALRTKLK
jgi:GT2 family glycosyltransferase/glycosyltransferase involved in cell wall biosynthesis